MVISTHSSLSSWFLDETLVGLTVPVSLLVLTFCETVKKLIPSIFFTQMVELQQRNSASMCIVSVDFQWIFLVYRFLIPRLLMDIIIHYVHIIYAPPVPYFHL